MDYLYDGTYSGLLCCIYAHYYIEPASGIFRESEYQTRLFDQACRIETEEEKAAKVYRAIRTKLGELTLRRSYLAYLSCAEDREMKLLRYLVFGFQTGIGFNRLHGRDEVFQVQAMEKHIYGERHRYLGILRFSVISAQPGSGGINDSVVVDGVTDDKDGDADYISGSTGIAGFADGETGCKKRLPHREVLYAQIEPQNDLLELMADHFLERYRSDPFIIHDIQREKALFAGGGQWYIASLPADIAVRLSQGELMYRTLWKSYFDTIAIKERTNPRCQKNFMPMRYWNHLTEKLM